VNVVAAVLLGRDRHGSLNLEAAFRHVLADLLGSLGVVAAALVILVSGWLYADPLISVLIGVLVLASSWTILRDSIDVLLETTPRGVDARAVGAALAGQPEVVDVHDLHIWTITSGFPALAAHVLCRPGADCHAVRRDLERLLRERFAIEHTTLQVDHAPGKESAIELGAVTRRQTPV
jgi:cobalt-zinc-cadmium efflux system protein